jgi:hypothetical protein
MEGECWNLNAVSTSYTCLFSGQNGEEGFPQEEERLIPQQFNILLWIWYKTV